VPGRYTFLAVLLMSLAAFFFIFEAARGIEPALRGLDTALRGPSLERTAPVLATSPVPRATQVTQQDARVAATPAQQAAAPVTTPAPVPRATPTATAGAERTHVVEAGDTLWSLAQRYDSTVEAIIAANNLPDRSATLRIGQTLVIPRSRG
jgi:membrane-bound lytic murein transglycosylase D